MWSLSVTAETLTEYDSGYSKEKENCCLKTKWEPFPFSKPCFKPTSVRPLMLLFQLGRTIILGGLRQDFFFSKAPGAHPVLLLLESVLSTYNWVMRLCDGSATGLFAHQPSTSIQLGASNCLFYNRAWRSNCSFPSAWHRVPALPFICFRADKCHFAGLVPWSLLPRGTFPIPVQSECFLFSSRSKPAHTLWIPLFPQLSSSLNNHLNK